jgi:hypothetical protein
LFPIVPLNIDLKVSIDTVPAVVARRGIRSRQTDMNDATNSLVSSSVRPKAFTI